ncbi:MAG: hypothetical protein IJH20_05200 [Bacilli bacterium]|nr:hypothetical protein [Bacilli bacterium]
MDYLLYFLVDLILDEGVGATKNKKLPKGVRYFLFALILILYLGIIGVFTVIGISLLKESLVEGILTLAFSLCIFIVCILRFKAVYKKKNK